MIEQDITLLAETINEMDTDIRDVVIKIAKHFNSINSRLKELEKK